MNSVDKHNRFDEEVFTYSISKDKKIFISWNGKQVTILNGKDSEKFLRRIQEANHLESQLIMAKATGNFKHGNERVAKEKSRI